MKIVDHILHLLAYCMNLLVDCINLLADCTNLWGQLMKYTRGKLFRKKEVVHLEEADNFYSFYGMVLLFFEEVVIGCGDD